MTDEVTEVLLEPCHGKLHGDGDIERDKADRPAASRRRSLGCWAPAKGFSRSSHAEAAALAGEGSTRGARVGEMEVDGPGGVGEEEKEARGRALRHRGGALHLMERRKNGQCWPLSSSAGGGAPRRERDLGAGGAQFRLDEAPPLSPPAMAA